MKPKSLSGILLLALLVLLLSPLMAAAVPTSYGFMTDEELKAILNDPDPNKVGGFTYFIEQKVGKEKADEIKKSLGPAYTTGGTSNALGSKSNPFLYKDIEALVPYSHATTVNLIGQYYQSGDSLWQIDTILSYQASGVFAGSWLLYAQRVPWRSETIAPARIPITFDAR